MKIHVIVKWDKSEDFPEIADAWTEYDVEGNPDGFDASMKKHKCATQEVREGIVEVPDGFLESLFDPKEVKGKVAEE